MQAKWMRRFGMGALLVGLGWTSVGCAGERDPINRIQPNAMPKSFFIGKIADASDDPEFYMRNTIVDVPYGAAQDGLFTATYAQPTNRIKWEVQEKALIARSTFERIQDADHKGSRRTTDGQVVGMFAIESHFDIRRDYNSSTGEEMNVVVENNTDRPWYQREFIRVDWSKNLVTDGYEVDTLSQIGLYGGVKFSPLEYKVEDPDSPDAPVFAPEEGYFDVATKAFATPQMVPTPWGDFPACYFYGIHPAGNCNPTELTLRLSFRKVVETDFEPSDWDGTRMDAFGAFYADRYGYERNYGILDTKWHRLAAKYNMFERSHISQKLASGQELFAQCNVDFWRDENGDVMKFKVDGAGKPVTDPTSGLPIPDPNGKPLPGSSVAVSQARDANRWKILDADDNRTDDECEFRVGGQIAHPGSRCDTLSHRCTLPLNERKTKKIPWYYGKDGPADLFPSTAVALEQWNASAKQAIQVGKKVDAMRVGKEAEAATYVTSEEQIAKREGAAANIEDIFVLCHSPVLEADDKACGKPGTIARIGDIRYNSVNIINTPQDPSPWGIMVDGDDPLTGEKVTTSVNEWGHILDMAVQGTADYLRWLNGEITDEQVSSGEYMLDWARASNFGQNALTPKVLSQADVQSRVGSVGSADGNGNFVPRRSRVAGEQLSAREMRGKLKAKAQARKQSGVPLDRDNEIEARRRRFVGSKFETLLATKEMQVAAGVDARAAGPITNDAMLARVSPLRGLNPELHRWLQRQKDTRAHEHASCNVQGPEPTAQMGLARQAQKLYPLPDKADPDYAAKKQKRDRDLFQWLREQFHISVILHEMGHSMGLRHNFAGNFDAMNFATQYWQLRTRNGAEKVCQPEGKTGTYKPHTNGEDCVGGRWFDPITETEQNGLLAKWGSSTVMDYPGDSAQDMNGLGKYDRAWMRFMYADAVDVDVDSDRGEKANYYPSLVESNTGGILGPFFTPAYWKFNDLFNLVGNCEGGSPQDPLAAKCTGQVLDYRKVYDMLDARGATKSKEFGDIDYAGQFNKSADGFARHPYMFSSDEFADGGNVLVYRHDAGADLYEQAQYFIASYENRYIFDNFRRNRVMFNVDGAVNRVLGRYFEKMTATTKAIGLILPDLGSDAGVYLEHEDLLLTHALASSLGFEAFIKVLTRPEPGAYRYSKSRDFTDTCTTKSYAEVAEYYADDLCKSENEKTPPAFTLKIGQGGVRYMHNEYDYSKGYEWSSYLRWVGSYYEKVYVQFFLNEAYNNFLQNSRDDYIDGRDRNINYATVYPEQMRRLTASLLQNDNTFYAPYVLPQQPGFAVSADPVNWLPLDRFTQSDPGTVALAYPAGAVRINPLVGWEQQLPATLFTYIYGSTTATMDWANTLRIWYPNSDGALSVPLEQQVRYQDPVTGLEYAARTYGKESIVGKQVQRTAGARMLQYANEFAANAFVVLTTDPVTGQHTYQRAGVANEPVCKAGLDADQCTAARKRIRYFGGNLDTMREIGLYVQGPLSSGQGGDGGGGEE